MNKKNRFINQDGFQQLLTKVINIEESPVEKLKILHSTGLQKPEIQQQKKLKLMSVEFIKLLVTKMSVSKEDQKINEMEPSSTKKLRKCLCKLRSDNMLSNILSCKNKNRKIWIAAFIN